MPFFGCLLARTFTNIGQGHGPWQGPWLARDVKEASAGNGTSQIKRSYFFGTEEELFSDVPLFLINAGKIDEALWASRVQLTDVIVQKESVQNRHLKFGFK